MVSDSEPGEYSRSWSAILWIAFVEIAVEVVFSINCFVVVASISVIVTSISYVIIICGFPVEACTRSGSKKEFFIVCASTCSSHRSFQFWATKRFYTLKRNVFGVSHIEMSVSQSFIHSDPPKDHL